MRVCDAHSRCAMCVPLSVERDVPTVTTSHATVGLEPILNDSGAWGTKPEDFSGRTVDRAHAW